MTRAVLGLGVRTVVLASAMCFWLLVWAGTLGRPDAWWLALLSAMGFGISTWGTIVCVTLIIEHRRKIGGRSARGDGLFPNARQFRGNDQHIDHGSTVNDG